MRAIWKGNISFALVTIPISLYSATKRNELSFHYLHKPDMCKVSYKRFCEGENREVEWDEITRGYEFEKGRYVEITDEDLERAEMELSKTIQVVEFVQEQEIGAVYFDKPYYLEPQKGGERAYALMREALLQSRRVGIARVVLRTKEHLAALRVMGDVLCLQTMRFAHEIVEAEDLKLPKGLQVAPKEMALANTLIDSMSDRFEPAKYKDEYYEKVMAVIKNKLDGIAPAAVAARPEAPGKVVDLMEILKASLAETQSRPGTRSGTSDRTTVREEEVVVAGGRTSSKGSRSKKAK